MSELNIVSVGVDIPGLGDKYKSFDSMASLASYDIIVFRPDMPYLGYNAHIDFSDGGRALTGDAYNKLKKQTNHWKTELNDALKHNKTVIILAAPNEEIKYTIGCVSPRKGVSNYTTSEDNLYDCLLPYAPKIREAKGCEFSACKNDIQQLTTQLHNSCKAQTTYEVIFTEIDPSCSPLLATKSNQVVGFIKRYETTGKLLFWPNINFNYKGSTYEENKKCYWTKEALAVGKAFVASIVALYKSYQTIKEPAPDWVLKKGYITEAERDVLTKIKDNENKQKKLTDEAKKLQENLQQEQLLKSLLYAQGKELEAAVNQALGILGLKVKNYHFKTKHLEIDNLIDYKGIKIVGETEGKDSGAVAVNKIRQLVSNKDEYYMEEIEDLSAEPKGILFGNSERLRPISERTLDFTDACKQISNSKKIALVKTCDLFDVVFYLKNSPDRNDFANKCVEAMINTESGIVKFPKPN